jgi:hypothetical protein
VLQAVSSPFVDVDADSGTVQHLADVPQLTIDPKTHDTRPTLILGFLSTFLQNVEGVPAQWDRPVVVVFWCSDGESARLEVDIIDGPKT